VFFDGTILYNNDINTKGINFRRLFCVIILGLFKRIERNEENCH